MQSRLSLSAKEIRKDWAFTMHKRLIPRGREFQSRLGKQQHTETGRRTQGWYRKWPGTRVERAGGSQIQYDAGIRNLDSIPDTLRRQGFFFLFLAK